MNRWIQCFHNVPDYSLRQNFKSNDFHLPTAWIIQCTLLKQSHQVVFRERFCIFKSYSPIKQHRLILPPTWECPSCAGTFHPAPQWDRADLQATATRPFLQMSPEFYFHVPDPETKVKPVAPETPEQAAGLSCAKLRFLCPRQPRDNATLKRLKGASSRKLEQTLIILEQIQPFCKLKH